MKSTNDQISEYLLVSMGAVPGALMRWRINDDLYVNLIGSFLLGLLIGLQLRFKWQLLFGIGFCGALTTFSGWMMNCFLLIKNDAVWEAMYLLGLSLGLGLVIAAIGFLIGRKIRFRVPFLLH